MQGSKRDRCKEQTLECVGEGEGGMTEDEMVGWHHQLNGHEFEQTPGDGEGQGSLVCCSPWGHKELDTTEQLKNNNKVEKDRAKLVSWVFSHQSMFSFFFFLWPLEAIHCLVLFFLALSPPSANRPLVAFW